MSRTPCYKCADRTVTCHSECEKYKGWRKELEEKKRAEAIDQISANARSTAWEHMRRATKWQKKKD